MKSDTAIVCLSPYYGGMELDSIRLYHLLSLEMNAYLVVRGGSKLEKAANAEISRKQILPIHFTLKLGPSFVYNFRKFLKDKKIRNIVYFGASELISIFFSSLGLDLNLIVRHGTTKNKPKKDIYHRLIYSKVNWHIGISNHILNNVKQIVPLSESVRLKRIYLSRRIDGYRNCRKDGKIKIVHVGRMISGKGQMDAVTALAKLNDKGFDFEANFLGGVEDEAYFNKIKKYIVENKLEDRININGHVENVIDYLKDSDIFLYPSHGEGMPNVVVESMAVGLVPVTYDNTVFPEFRALGFHIVLAKHRDTQMLAEKLLHVAINLEEHLQKSKINVLKYQEFFSPSVEKNDYLSVLI